MDLLQMAADVAAANPKTAAATVLGLSGAYAVQGLCAWLAKVTKRSHSTQFNTVVSKIAAFPLPHIPGGQ